MTRLELQLRLLAEANVAFIVIGAGAQLVCNVCQP